MSSNPIRIEWKEYLGYIELMIADLRKILATKNMAELESLRGPDSLYGTLLIPPGGIWAPNHLWTIYGEARGGLIPAVILSHALKINIRLDRAVGRCIFVDDILDTGQTYQSACTSGMSVKSLGAFLVYRDGGGHKTLYRPTYYVHRIGPDDGRVIFPYEDPDEV
jgi:hypothetical protein